MGRDRYGFRVEMGMSCVEIGWGEVEMCSGTGDDEKLT